MMTTKRWLGRGGVVVLLVLGVSAATSQGGLVNPHLRPEPCMSCHSKVPSEAEARAGQYFHLQPTIDETCKICHSCCKTGVRHLEMNHPTDLADWDRSRFKAPLTLPLHNNKITCNTCHLHRAPEEPTIHLLRKVRIDARVGMDWSELCRDCHVGY